jgi:cytochrome b6-f complex iron-sulfur subunit
MTALLTIIVIVAVLAVIAGAFFVLGRRDTTRAVGTLSAETKSRDLQRRAAELEEQSTDIEAWTPPTPEAVGVSRRQFLNRGIWSMAGLGALGFGTGLISFLWPRVSGGFGSKINLGKISDLKGKIQAANGFYYVPEGKLYVVDFPISALPKAKQVYQPAELASMQAGVTVLYQKCPHLGCRVPPCLTSQWFECPCHGSQYNQVGEHKAGPAPRGMDHFATSVSAGTLTVDTGAIIQGAPIGVNTTGQEPAGPHCVSGGE